ncbi:Tyrosine-protein phosphatase non-receptor type 1 [Halotydeus destructor]|nr:Tyrosine-protein phosphatase non-receptor type 1 [Halotydeus destructor]
MLEDEFNDLQKNDQWTHIFMEIHHKANEYPYTCKDARKPENEGFNRYRDVAPFDHNRIRLQRGDIDYINASLIPVEEADRAYILTQGPLPHTVAHFWVMIWEQKSKAILMLNGLIERGAIKCHKYWPDPDYSERIASHLESLQLSVKLVSQEEKEHYVIRKCLLTDLKSNESREVLQFHYTAWPDFGLPESPASFLEFLTAVRQCGALDKNLHGPPIVHCSAGIGRSGTFCLVDSSLVLIEKRGPSAKVDCRQMLLEMRRCRRGLIQTPDQLRFSYLAILEGSKHLLNVPLESEGCDIRARISDTSKEANDKDGDTDDPKQISAPIANETRAETRTQDSPTNNNADNGATELRRRVREERNKKTKETIEKIKGRQKEIEERNRYKSQIFKIGCVGLALMLSAGFVYGYFNPNNFKTPDS